MDRLFVNTILFATCFLISFSCAGNKSIDKNSTIATEATTLYGNSFLKGRIRAITNSDKYGADSPLFVYNENGNENERNFLEAIIDLFYDCFFCYSYAFIISIPSPDGKVVS